MVQKSFVNTLVFYLQNGSVLCFDTSNILRKEANHEISITISILYKF